MEPQVALTMPLLEGTDGVRKMSKSYGNYVGLTDEPADAFGKVMSIPDEMIGKYYRLASTLSVDEGRPDRCRARRRHGRPVRAQARARREHRRRLPRRGVPARRPRPSSTASSRRTSSPRTSPRCTSSSPPTTRAGSILRACSKRRGWRLRRRGDAVSSTAAALRSTAARGAQELQRRPGASCMRARCSRWASASSRASCSGRDAPLRRVRLPTRCVS